MDFAKGAANELGSCMKTCGDVCKIAKNSTTNESFGFNQLTLTKSGSINGVSTNIYCSCPCS